MFVFVYYIKNSLALSLLGTCLTAHIYELVVTLEGLLYHATFTGKQRCNKQAEKNHVNMTKMVMDKKVNSG